MFKRLGAFLLVGSVVATVLLPTMTAAFSSSSSPPLKPKTLRPESRDSVLLKTPQQQHYPHYPHNLLTTTSRYYRDDRHADGAQHTTETPATVDVASSTSSNDPLEQSPHELQQTQQTQSSSPGTGAVNLQMIQNLCLSQGVILALTTVVAAVSLHYTPQTDWSTVWNWSPLASYAASTSDTASTTSSSSAVISNTIVHLWQGVAATFPLIGLKTWMHKSQDQDANKVNFATTNMVVTLFGRRRDSSPVAAPSKQPKDSNDNDISSKRNVVSTTCTGTDPATTFQVIAWSVLVTTLTAVSEEIVIRGYSSGLVMALTGSWAAAWLVPAVFLGAGNWHSGSTLGENKIVIGSQTLNGIWYGVVYMATGSLIPGMMAHLLYDTHVLVAAWHQVNEQMDWTEEAYPTALSPSEEADIREIQRMSGEALTTETLNFCRRFFYAFDHEHCKSLSLHDVRQAVSYAFLQDKVAPSSKQVQDMFAMVLNERGDPRRHYDDDADDPADAVNCQDDLPVDRLRLTEFLGLLFALRAQTYQKASVSPQQA
jgi:hypothetical protein